MLDHLNDPEVFQLVKIYQVHVHFRFCWKYNIAFEFLNFAFRMADTLLRKKLLQNRFMPSLPMMKSKIFNMEKCTIKQIKIYIASYLNPAKLYLIDAKTVLLNH